MQRVRSVMRAWPSGKRAADWHRRGSLIVPCSSLLPVQNFGIWPINI